MRFSIHEVSWGKLFGERWNIPVHVVPGCTGRRPLKSTGYAFFSKPYLEWRNGASLERTA